MKITFDKYEFEVTKDNIFCIEQFENDNEWYYQQKRLEANPSLAYMINDWDLDKYYDDIDWDTVKDDMAELYRLSLDENF